MSDVNREVAEAVGWKWRVPKAGGTCSTLTRPDDVSELAKYDVYVFHDQAPAGIEAFDSDLPRFDTDLNAAWEAAETFLAGRRPEGSYPIVKLQNVEGKYCAVVCTMDTDSKTSHLGHGGADTPALAICRAILRARSVERR